MKKFNGKAILGGVAGLGLLGLSLFSFLKKNKEGVEDIESIYDEDELEVVDYDESND